MRRRPRGGLCGGARASPGWDSGPGRGAPPIRVAGLVAETPDRVRSSFLVRLADADLEQLGLEGLARS